MHSLAGSDREHILSQYLEDRRKRLATEASLPRESQASQVYVERFWLE